MADDTHDSLAKALAGIVARQGEAVLEDRRKVTALLADTLPDSGRETRLLGIAVDNGAVRAISRARLDQVELEIDRHAQRIDRDLGVRKTIVVPVLRAVAYATGRGALPSMLPAIETTSQARANPRAAPASEDSWIGVSAGPAPAAPTPAAPPPSPAVLPQPAPAAAPAKQQPAPGAGSDPEPPASAAAPAPSPVTARKEPMGLGGWLIAWPVVVVAADWWLAERAVRLFNLINYCSSSRDTGDVRSELYLVTTLVIALALASLPVLWLHVRRVRSARIGSCLWLIACACLPAYEDGLRVCANARLRTSELEIGVPIVIAVVGVAYFLFSRRSRNTFVR